MPQKIPLQNRVAPDGTLHAVTDRGTMMGNRGGKFHRDDKTLGKRRWASHHWICCDLHYKNMHHEAMGQGYTSLFFLDEVTALAAGHRPCFYCRRGDAKAFLGEEKVEAFDQQVHAERIFSPSRAAWGSTPKGGGGVATSPEIKLTGNALKHPLGLRPVPPALRREEVPDGAMIEVNGFFLARRGHHLLRWSFGGYVTTEKFTAGMNAKLLTPPSITAILAKGYQPRWHPSALQLDD